MCVIVYKRKGYEIPSKKFLQRCYYANPNGVGFAYNDNNNVYYRKGFEKFKDFYDTLLEINNNVKLYNKDLIIHFRIATSGGVTPEKTHPFMITHSFKKMEQLQGCTKSVFFHNGIIKDFGNQNYSDTEMYNSMILANIKNLEQQDTLIDYLAKKENSKFAIMLKNRVILGNDFLVDSNMLVSNKNYSYYYNDSYNNYNKISFGSNLLDKGYKKDYLYNDYNRYKDYFD